MKHVPVSERRLPLVTFDEDFEDQINEFIAKLSNVLRYTLEDAAWTDLMASKEAERDTVDLIDGRLFRVVIQAMCDNTLKTALPLGGYLGISLISYCVMF